MSAGAGALSDRQMPGLGIAMDREALLEALAAHLPECRRGVRLLDARVADVQYAPGAAAKVLWKLNVHDPETGRTGRQLIVVKALRRDDSPPAEPAALVRRYRELRERKGMERELPLRTPWLLLPGPRLVVHAFPLDPALPTLLDVADPRAVAEALHRAWRPRRARVRRVRVETLSYTPEARAALRYEVLAEDKDTGIPELRRLVGKLDARRSPARLFAGHWAVWRGVRGRASVAPPVGYIAVAGLSLQEFVPGTRLTDLAGGGAFVGQVRQTARSIAAVHALTLPLPGRRGVEKEMAAVDRWIGVLSRLRPGNAGRLEALGGRLRRELAGRMRITATVHADFHLANVLADDHGVTLVDWDQAAHGDPMVDVGRVLASLRVSSLRVHGTLDGFADVEESFLRAYLGSTGDDERRARLFEAVSLLVAAAAPFRLQREGWEEGAERMLDEVDRVLGLSLAGRRGAGTAPDLEREVPFEDRPGWVLDRAYAQALLVPVVHAAHGPDIEVTECRPALLERGPDGLHVRWTVKGYRGSERWRGVVEGVGFRDDSGRGRLRRLEAAAAALETDPAAFRLPLPLGHLAPLAIIVFVPPEGRPLAGVLGTEGEAGAVETVAGALARLHALAVDLGKERETERDLRSVGRRVERLGEAGHPGAATARELFDSLRPLLRRVGERRSPTVRGLHVRRIVVAAGSAGAALLDDVLLAEPLLAVGELAAQLRSHALERGAPPRAADRFASAYAEAAGAAVHELAAFQALALLARACRRGVRNPADALVEPLLSAARGLLAAAAPGGSAGPRDGDQYANR